MITDASQNTPPTARDWAVFRYGLISEAVSPMAGQKVSQILAVTAARVHQLPDHSFRRYNIATLRMWLGKYLHGGLDDLHPKPRSDKGEFRSIDDDTAEIIARHRVQHRRLSVKLFWEILHEDDVLPEGVQIKEGTLRRFLKARGLAKKQRGPEKARAKFEMPDCNDLWIADFERHEALPNRAVMKGHRRVPVAAGT